VKYLLTDGLGQVREIDADTYDFDPLTDDMVMVTFYGDLYSRTLASSAREEVVVEVRDRIASYQIYPGGTIVGVESPDILSAATKIARGVK